ncbi:Putative mycofactocin radical SAM maturase MftC [Methylococcales bacterium]|nr:Putative mycofactocin radical SAM maturase MftC [Methylococcales bacterium]
MPIELQLPAGVPPLTTYYMYITGGCNLACRHCWIAPTYEPNGGTGQCLDFELYKLAIEQALPLGLTSIKFTGGEPLLHPGFVHMVDYATERGLRTWMETNGTLITRELARHLKEETSLYSISVSLDGAIAQTHEYMRNVPGSFEMAKQGVRYLVEAGYKPQVIMSLYPGNVDEIEVLIQWAVESGCGSVKFNLIQTSGRGKLLKDQGNLLPIERLVELGHWLEKTLQNRVAIPIFYSWPMSFQGIRRLNENNDGICGVHNILGVLSTGHLAMCGIGTQEKDLIYGRLGEDAVCQIWNSHPLLMQLRHSIPARLEGICGRCIFRDYCLGECVAQNYYANRRLTASFWFCHMADEAGFFPRSRYRGNILQ